MNLFDLDATGLMVWGLIAHLIADWPLQNDWMANNKMKLGHPAGIVHAGIHFVALAIVFGWLPGVLLGLSHYLIDLRVPVAWWSRLIRQTQPKHPVWVKSSGIDPSCGARESVSYTGRGAPLMDVGMEVRFWTDQVFHIACIAVAALIIGATA